MKFRRRGDLCEPHKLMVERPFGVVALARSRPSCGVKEELMSTFHIQARWEPTGALGAGSLHITLIESDAILSGAFGEIVSARPKRRRKEIVLRVTSNIADLSGLAPWEREILAPVVTRLMQDVLSEEACNGESGEDPSH